ncbi:fimbrillin family protein [Bacteroides ovatus]|uniref:fimbrillin family protein n=2 Tax=Bacteroides ovatus TaxID=28116 RepID=UPI00321AE1EE
MKTIMKSLIIEMCSKVYFRMYLAGWLVCFLLISCEEIDELNNEIIKVTKNELKLDFELSSTTRVITGNDYKTTFDNGDAIGVFIVKRSMSTLPVLSPSENFAHNIKLVYNKSLDRWVFAGEPIVVSESQPNMVLDFYAYYPYVDAANPTALICPVITDQSNSTNFNGATVLVSKKEGVPIDTEKVTLSLSHLMSLVQVQVTDTDSGVKTKMNLCAKVGATYNLLNPTDIVTTGPVSDIIMKRVESDNNTTSYTYWAIVPPQTIDKNEILFKSTLGWKYKAGEEVSLKPGSVEKYEIGK